MKDIAARAAVDMADPCFVNAEIIIAVTAVQDVTTLSAIEIIIATAAIEGIVSA